MYRLISSSHEQVAGGGSKGGMSCLALLARGRRRLASPDKIVGSSARKVSLQVMSGGPQSFALMTYTCATRQPATSWLKGRVLQQMEAGLAPGIAGPLYCT